MSDDEGMMAVGRQRSNSAPAILREEVDLELEGVTPEPEEDSPLVEDEGNIKKKRPKTGTSGSRNITVLARFRPENAQEVANGGQTCVEYSPDNKSVTMKQPDRTIQQDAYQFFYHHVFQSFASQTDIHAFVGEPVCDAFFSGVNCSVLAYGQTGSGKTYTMMGVVDSNGMVIDAQGLIPRMFTNIFRYMQEREDVQIFDLSLTFVELYMEKLQDLLHRPEKGTGNLRPTAHGFIDDREKMNIHGGPDGTTTITNCTSVAVQSMPQAMSVVQRGLQRRTTASTKSNKESSRSHAVLVLTLSSQERDSRITRNSQLYLVDLAGSEKVSKTEADGMRLDEAKNINQSLFSLGQVVSALSQKKPRSGRVHVPYRDSKLTRLLENSLGGNALTYMIVTCSPNSFNDQETLSTLRFGAKAQMIRTKPVKNQFRTVEELEFMLEKAKQEIEMQKSTIALLKNQVKTANSANRGGAPAATETPGNNGKGAALMNNLLENRFSSILTTIGTCPIGGLFMRDPVVALDGMTYERRNITNYLMREENDLISPTTGVRINATAMTPNLLLKNLFEMCRDAGISYQMDELTICAPTSPFLVFDILGVIMEFIPLGARLMYSRTNTVFAQVVYDRSVWADAIQELIAPLPLARQQTINALQLPAHKVYLSLMSGDGGEMKKLDKLQFSTTSLKLYSNGLKR